MGSIKDKMDLRTIFNKDEYNYDKARPDYPSELFEGIFKYSNPKEKKEQPDWTVNNLIDIIDLFCN